MTEDLATLTKQEITAKAEALHRQYRRMMREEVPFKVVDGKLVYQHE